MPKSNNRIGTFRLSWRYLESWEELLPLMGNFVVLRAECHYAQGDILITAYSPLFEVVPEHTAAPFYEITINIHDFSPAEIIAKRVPPGQVI